MADTKIEQITNSIATSFNSIKAKIFPPAQEVVNPYYVDTIAKVGEEVNFNVQAKPNADNRNLLDIRIDALSSNIDEELEKGNCSFEKLHAMIHQVVMMLMRRCVKTDQEFISELNIQIKVQAVKIQETYNTWAGMTITVVSAVISMGGGIAGLSPLAPTTWVAGETAKALAQSSQAIGTAGTGLGGIGSIFNNRQEGQRQVYQIHLKGVEEKKSHREETKHGHNDSKKGALETMKGLAQQIHEAIIRVVGG